MVVVEKPSQCPICMDVLDTVEKSVEKPIGPCGHWMHVSCMEKCSSALCPICRAPVPIKVYGKKYEPDFEDLSSGSEEYIIVRRRSTRKGERHKIIAEMLKEMEWYEENLDDHNEYFDLDKEFIQSVLSYSSKIYHEEMKACREALAREKSYHSRFG